MPRVLRLHEFSGPSGLQIDELPLVEPTRNEVRIQVDAFALNYGDFELMENGYVFEVELPSRMGDECAGTIDAIGPDVTDLKVGERVSTIPWMNAGFGVDGEFAIVPETYVKRYPANLSATEGCSIWVQYLTAYYALIEISKVGEGDFVLITAATSSAGMAAIETAHKAGAKVIGTTRSPENVTYLADDIGCDFVIDTNIHNIGEKVLEFTDGKACRAIYDPVGGRIVQDYEEAIGRNCDIYLYGGMDPSPTIVPEIKMTQMAAVFRPYSVYNHICYPEQLERGINYVYKALESGDFKPKIDRVFEFEDYKEAFAFQKVGKGRRGKIVIKLE